MRGLNHNQLRHRSRYWSVWEGRTSGSWARTPLAECVGGLKESEACLHQVALKHAARRPTARVRVTARPMQLSGGVGTRLITRSARLGGAGAQTQQRVRSTKWLDSRSSPPSASTPRVRRSWRGRSSWRASRSCAGAQQLRSAAAAEVPHGSAPRLRAPTHLGVPKCERAERAPTRSLRALGAKERQDLVAALQRSGQAQMELSEGRTAKHASDAVGCCCWLLSAWRWWFTGYRHQRHLRACIAAAHQTQPNACTGRSACEAATSRNGCCSGDSRRHDPTSLAAPTARGPPSGYCSARGKVGKKDKPAGAPRSARGVRARAPGAAKNGGVGVRPLLTLAESVREMNSRVVCARAL
jgi:hypothetical protein